MWEIICLEPSPEEEDIKTVSMMRILKLNTPEWYYLLVGSIAAVVVGASLPIFAILFGEFYGVSEKYSL